MAQASTRSGDAASTKSIVALVGESLRCLDIAPRGATPEGGLTAVLSVESDGRADVLDLDRAFFMGDGGTADVSWLSLPRNAVDQSFHLLLKVAVTGPVQCGFVVGIPVPDGDSEGALRKLAHLFAADKLALTFDTSVTADSAIVVAAPTDRRALLAAIDTLRD
jgi:hypothetical protein